MRLAEALATLRASLPVAEVHAVARDAGPHIAAYLPAHRIPRAMRLLPPPLPARLAARVLLMAIGRHAWTVEGLFRALVLPAARVVETACEAAGAPRCIFQARWPGRESV
jgi:divinyl protochlorophyllide a 8-vinyl-reductase